MTEKERKVLKIIDVFYTYCVYVGGTDIHVDTKLNSDGDYAIHVSSNYAPKGKETLNNLLNILNKPKDSAMEAMYWSVIGNTEFQDDNDIYVVGSMVDTADVDIGEDHFEVWVTKNY